MEQSTINTYPVIELGKAPKNTWDKLLQAIRIKPSYHRFELTPMSMGSRCRMAEKITSLPDSISIDRIDKSMFNLYTNHIDKLIYIIAVGMVNNDQAPSARLLARIKKDFSTEDLYNAMRLVLAQANPGSFTACLILLLGEDILQVPAAVEENNSIQLKNTENV